MGGSLCSMVKSFAGSDLLALAICRLRSISFYSFLLLLLFLWAVLRLLKCRMYSYGSFKVL